MTASSASGAAVFLLSAVMAFPVSVVVTVHIGIKGKISRKQSVYRFVRAAGHPAVELNSRLSQSSLGASADSAAD